jgi:beta-phosphoglucomutase-like phosphatase (HAD superfamily)
LKRCYLPTPQSHLDIFKHFHPHVLTSNSPPVPPATQPTKGKPHPDIFLAAARSLGFNVGTEEEPANDDERRERARGLVFEDALPGVESGLRSGMNGPSLLLAEATAPSPLSFGLRAHPLNRSSQSVGFRIRSCASFILTTTRALTRS